MMKKLCVEFEHCYGIKKLQAEFDFETCGDVFAVYAPNGTMKTSFAHTFRDLSEGEESSDLVTTSNETKRIIKNEDGQDLTAQNVFVIEPYNSGYRSDRISLLLVNDELRKRYESIHKAINEKTENLIKTLKPFAGSKTDVMTEIAISITQDQKEFYLALARVENEVKNIKESPLGDVVYSDIFNSKVEPVLESAEFKNNIQNYMEKYDELLSRSTFFKKGVFTHNNADDVAKNLDNNQFFKANHSVYLCINGQKTEINSIESLKDAIQAEKAFILTNDDLESAFSKIDNQLQKNQDLRNFRKCLEENRIVIGELSNPARLRQKLWVEYLSRSRDAYLNLRTLYGNAEKEIDEIVAQAQKETTKWADVISIFNDRFSVPFVVRIDNQDDVILKRGTPIIGFSFINDPDDPSENTPIKESKLMEVLSNGESRALYILNIIFEVEARKESGQNTLFIVDDIADSFDYKNKYAIIEYLMEIKEHVGFQQILMSHNFDFYRTVSERLELPRSSRILVSKEGGEINFVEEQYQNNPFSHWIKHLSNTSMLVASIPFLRNLAQYSGDDESKRQLTSLLHIRTGAEQFTISMLNDLIKKIMHNQSDLELENPENTVKDLIYEVAGRIADDESDQASLENKIAISVAIRLKAEEFMIKNINNEPFLDSIAGNQTITLINRFKQDFPNERENIKILGQVNLMTPENIHLNSFMYEPILDLSIQHLIRLFNKVDSMQIE